MRRRLFLGVLAALVLAAPAFTGPALAQETPLIPREILVGNPAKAACPARLVAALPVEAQAPVPECHCKA